MPKSRCTSDRGLKGRWRRKKFEKITIEGETGQLHNRRFFVIGNQTGILSSVNYWWRSVHGRAQYRYLKYGYTLPKAGVGSTRSTMGKSIAHCFSASLILRRSRDKWDINYRFRVDFRQIPSVIWHQLADHLTTDSKFQPHVCYFGLYSDHKLAINKCPESKDVPRASERRCKMNTPVR